MENIRLSLCMIVKNEEDCIDRCLKSVKDVVDEIIIVDTGSTDKTVDICKAYEARIETFKWNGSFADARNHGINKANGEWILWLDADEEWDQKDLKKLQDNRYFKDYDVLTIRLINYYGEKAHPNQTTDVAHTRLFRRSTGIRFINKIHECLDIVDMDPGRIGHLDASVHHYGYLDPIVDKKGKFERNIKMLEQQLKDKENVFWAEYYIAMEYYRKGDMKEAFERVNKSIKAFLLEGIIPPSMVYKLKYSILISMGSYEGAWPSIEKAIMLYPDYVDLHFFKGLILYGMKKYEEALETFEKCIEMGEDNINHLILRGVGTFQAWFYKGLCQQKLDNKNEAAVAYMHALAITPDYSPALDALKDIQKEKKLSLKEILKGYFKERDYQILLPIINKTNEVG